jgi:hypothetical protein
MNHADTCAELRRRGYPSTIAAEAVNQARIRTSATYPLERHLVRYTGNGDYRISPRPWPEGASRLPRPAPRQDPVPVFLPEILVKIAVTDAWLDSSAAPEWVAEPLLQDWTRVTKACEEAGEVWKEMSRWTGENPRKGKCGSREEVLGELGDVLMAALLAIQHITKDHDLTWQLFLDALDKAYRRVPPGQRHLHEDDGTAEGCPGCFEDGPDTASDAIRAMYAEPEGLYEDPPATCGSGQPHQRHVYSPAGGMIRGCPGVTG